MDYILEGSARLVRDRVWVSVQLIQVRDQTHLWPKSYERRGRPYLQNNVAQDIVRSLKLRLVPEQQVRARSRQRNSDSRTIGSSRNR